VSSSGVNNINLAYDPMGRLWQTSGGSTGTTRFLYEGDKRIIEEDVSGTRLRVYVHARGEDEPLVWYENIGGAFYYRFLHSDQQGSITAIADGSGNPIAINAYDAWGIPNPANQGRFGYTGQTWIPELGMWYYKARIYSPTLGRFLQTDPVGYKDQVNLYAYVGNDPMDRNDPSGLCGSTTESNKAAPAAPACVIYDVRPPTGPEKKFNTIVTDGRGGIKLQLNIPKNSGLSPEVQKSFRVHEGTHKDDFNQNACPCSRAQVAAAPAGYIVTPNTQAEKDKSEIRAYTAEIAYDRNALGSTGMDPAVSRNIVDNMNQAIDQLNDYKQKLSKLDPEQ
jgi:RHS repeat-associated protein